MFQQDVAPAHRARDTVAFLKRETDARNALSSISASVRVQGTFRAQILTMLSPFVMTTNNCQINHFSVYCMLFHSSDTLLQILHFNVM